MRRVITSVITILVLFSIKSYGDFHSTVAIDLLDWDVVQDSAKYNDTWNIWPQFGEAGNKVMRVTVERSFNRGKIDGHSWADPWPGYVAVLRSVYEDRTEYHTVQNLFYFGKAWSTSGSIDRGSEYVWYENRHNFTVFEWENTSVIFGLRLLPGTHTYREGYWTEGETPEEQFNGCVGAEITFVVPGYSGPDPPDEMVSIGNTQEWWDWEPKGNIDDQSKAGSKLKLELSINAEDIPGNVYTLHAKLRSTRLPARYTNDYIYTGEWDIPDTSDTATYKNETYEIALTEIDADLKLLQQLNSDWTIDFKVTEANLVSGKSGYGAFLAVYDQPVSDGDETSLTISSFDFAADGLLYLALEPYEGSIPAPKNFASKYFLRAPGDTVLALTLPRDEEIYADTMIFVDPKWGTIDTVVSLSYGDGLWDGWEEQYVDASIGSHGIGLYGLKEDFSGINPPTGDDLKIYPSIYECLPQFDDSWVNRTFFPEHDPSWPSYSELAEYDSVTATGDGLANREKYRGIYGILSGGSPTYGRLAPSVRNNIVVCYNRSLLTPDLPGSPDFNEYYNTQSPIRVIELHPNTPSGPNLNREQIEYYDYGFYLYWTGGDEYIEGDGLPPPHDYKYGSKWIDTLFPYPPEMPVKSTTVSWLYPYTSAPILLSSYLTGLPGYTVDNAAPGETLRFYSAPNFPGTTVDPKWNMLCNLYLNRIDDPAPTEAMADTARAIVYAHELSHIRMQNHPLSDDTLSLMSYPSWVEAFEPYTQYVETDFRIIALTIPRHWAYGGR